METLEGTWQEISVHSARLNNQRLRVQILGNGDSTAVRSEIPLHVGKITVEQEFVQWDDFTEYMHSVVQRGVPLDISRETLGEEEMERVLGLCS